MDIVCRIRRPPPFRDDFTVAHQHEAVNRIDVFLKIIHERQHPRGIDALRFGSTPGQTFSSSSVDTHFMTPEKQSRKKSNNRLRYG